MVQGSHSTTPSAAALARSKRALLSPKMLRDLGEIGGLSDVDRPVGLGDAEQPLDYVLEDFRRIGKQGSELAGVGLEARDVALGQIEEALDVAFLARRHLEEITERRASTSDTSPSARAILAPSAITPMVKAIWRRPGCAPSSAGGDVRPSSEPNDSPLARRVTASTILSQIFMPAPLRVPAHRIKTPIATPTSRTSARRR